MAGLWQIGVQWRAIATCLLIVFVSGLFRGVAPGALVLGCAIIGTFLALLAGLLRTAVTTFIWIILAIVAVLHYEHLGGTSPWTSSGDMVLQVGLAVSAVSYISRRFGLLTIRVPFRVTSRTSTLVGRGPVTTFGEDSLADEIFRRLLPGPTPAPWEWMVEERTVDPNDPNVFRDQTRLAYRNRPAVLVYRVEIVEPGRAFRSAARFETSDSVFQDYAPAGEVSVEPVGDKVRITFFSSARRMPLWLAMLTVFGGMPTHQLESIAAELEGRYDRSWLRGARKKIEKMRAAAAAA
ncbi:MAG: hypothetical protein AAGE18_13235 [Pseudomonadota bacterium]